jgi:hypothetical protein
MHSGQLRGKRTKSEKNKMFGKVNKPIYCTGEKCGQLPNRFLVAHFFFTQVGIFSSELQSNQENHKADAQAKSATKVRPRFRGPSEKRIPLFQGASSLLVRSLLCTQACFPGFSKRFCNTCVCNPVFPLYRFLLCCKNLFTAHCCAYEEMRTRDGFSNTVFGDTMPQARSHACQLGAERDSQLSTCSIACGAVGGVAYT